MEWQCGQKEPSPEVRLVQVLALPTLIFLSLSFLICKDEDGVKIGVMSSWYHGALYKEGMGFMQQCDHQEGD